ncbi:DUF2079 domain-containing protein [Patescibacteria group bacterium]|nr:DUF2079 domain-containing protein [Patescibacteria group bacterium]
MKISKLINFFKKKSWLILWLAIGLYFLIFSLICIWKYFNFGYNGLDLAIINQVFYNSAQGNLFGLTIHPHSYLGDHFALILILLLPFYYLWQHPINLLILQSLILALCAWPLYLIAKHKLSNAWPLFIALAWLTNPFVQNINIFEFHFLPWAIFFLFWTFYFYQQKNLAAFLVFAVLSLAVREDVALVVLMFSALALINRRSKVWIFTPGLMALSWFAAATTFIASITPTGSYKFFYYYSWLGGNLNEILTNALVEPQLILYRFLALNNLLFILALLLPFAFIFFDLALLLLGLLVFLQLSLGGSNNSLIVLKTHYSSLLLPALFIGYAYGLAKLGQTKFKFFKFKKYLFKERGLLVMIIGAAAIYSCLALGPLPAVVKQLFKPGSFSETRELKTEFYQSLPQTQSIAASYEFLTNLSSRPSIYSLHYAYIGKKQFSDIDYKLPADTRTLLFDFDDLVTYSVQFPNSSQWQKYYLTGDDNFRKIIQAGNYGVVKIADTLVRMDKNAETDIHLYQTAQKFTDIQHPQNIDFGNGLKFLGWSDNPPLLDSDKNFLPAALYFQTKQRIEKDYQLKLTLNNEEGQIVKQKYYPLAYGLYPTSEWQANEIVKINYWFLLPQKIADSNYQLELQLVYLEGFLKLNGLRSAVPQITQETILEPKITLIP